MHVEDPYHELGLTPGSSDAEVKAAWRRLSARWHPDRNDSPQALRKIQRINRALEEIRKARARPLDEAEDAEDAPPSAAAAPDGAPDDAESDQAKGAASDPRDPVVVELTLGVTVEDIATGCIKDVRGELVDDCEDCVGTGVDPRPTECPACSGEGSVRQGLWFGWVSTTATCTACAGKGSTRLGCATCESSGKLARTYHSRVRIAPGVRDGDVLHATARLRPGRHRQIDLHLTLALEPHDLFDVEVDGTIACEVPVDGYAWTANRWIDIPTPRGLQQMKLRRGFLSYRIREAGLAWGPTPAPADCMVTVVPLFPDELDAEQEAAIDRLVQANSGTLHTPAGERMAQWKAQIEAWQADRR